MAISAENYHLGRTELWMLIGQAVVILLMGLFVIYGDGQNADSSSAGEFEAEAILKAHYPMFMDVHCMIFVGFGFLMVFMKSYSWTAVGFNFLIACWASQLTYLMGYFWNHTCAFYTEDVDTYKKYSIDFGEMLFMAEFGSGAVLITFGALLGKLNLLQLWVVATIEIFFFSINHGILFYILELLDIGGAMTIHMFGAFFGLAAAYFFQFKKASEDKFAQNGSTFNSNLIAMIGTYFLFLYWPSFNGAIASGSF